MDVPDLRLAHEEGLVAALRAPTRADPWRILWSGCLAGLPCGVDGTHYGMGGPGAPAPLGRPIRTAPARQFPGAADVVRASELAAGELPWVRLAFCPEHHGLGTPRSMPDLHGGDGFDVLDGTARILDPHGTDLTAGMVAGARAMADLALAQRVDLAVLTDSSAACGTQVVYAGCRSDPAPVRRRGVGVAAAALVRAGIPVVSQRDHRTLARLRARLDPAFVIDPALRDHQHHPWVLEHLPE